MSVRSLIPNLLSTLRLCSVPYAFFCPVEWRFFFLVLVSLSDFFDGYLARKWGVTSRFGTLVDPLGDKGLAFAFSYLFWSEGLMSSSELVIFFSREWALLLFVAYVFLKGRWSQWTIQSFWCGKAATAFQALAATFLCQGIPAPSVVYGLLLLSGLAALPELLYRLNRAKASSLA